MIESFKNSNKKLTTPDKLTEDNIIEAGLFFQFDSTNVFKEL